MNTPRDPSVLITSARVDVDGRPAVLIDLIEVGGGTQTVTVDGTPEERVHPRGRVFHVRMLAPTRMLPDELREVATYEEAVELAEAYALKVAANAERLAEIADDLKV